jgi:cytochrome c oxidase subunit 4
MVHAQQSAEHHGHHIVPLKTLLTVFGGLIALTIVTVITSQIHLGPLNVPLALAIAITKATLVVLFFMALKYDRPVNTLVFMIGIIFVLVFLTFTWFDTGFRGDLGNVDSQTIQERTREEEALLERQARLQGMGGTAVDSTAAADTSAAAQIDTSAAPADTATASGAAH